MNMLLFMYEYMSCLDHIAKDDYDDISDIEEFRELKEGVLRAKHTRVAIMSPLWIPKVEKVDWFVELSRPKDYKAKVRKKKKTNFI